MNDNLPATGAGKSSRCRLNKNLAAVCMVFRAMFCVWPSVVTAAELGKPPNIVWIIAEDNPQS